LFLNLTEKPTDIKNASGKTLPTIVFSNSFVDWNDYLASLRSNYRRRLKMISRNNVNLRLEKKDCSAFTEEMHRQYLQVYKRSNGKLEKLSFEFFRNLPTVFILTVCYQNDTAIGWNIALYDNNVYYFFLGGIDYKFNRIHNTYLRLLMQLIQDGIESKAKIIELGQTAETPKMRMGGKPEILYMEAHHSNMVFNKLIKMSGSLLEYKMKAENTRAIKEE
jgi:predicted N-acyltransferase